jgi:predicted nucleotidyltransferase
MITTVSQITPAELKKYAQTARARALARRPQLETRRTQAWEVARRAAALLKEQFGVKRVVLFGSLTRGPGRFYIRSDVDLAVWGLDERRYLRALECLLSLNPKIDVDLIEFEFAQPRLQAAIERDGIEL